MRCEINLTEPERKKNTNNFPFVCKYKETKNSSILYATFYIDLYENLPFSKVSENFGHEIDKTTKVTLLVSGKSEDYNNGENATTMSRTKIN